MLDYFIFVYLFYFMLCYVILFSFTLFDGIGFYFISG